MKAADLIARADELCPNSFDMLFKLTQLTVAEDWLKRAVLAHFAQPTGTADESADGPSARLAADAVLSADSAEGESYYLNFLIAFFCLFNGENERYNQHITLSAAALRRLTEERLAGECPKCGGGFRF